MKFNFFKVCLIRSSELNVGQWKYLISLRHNRNRTIKSNYFENINYILNLLAVKTMSAVLYRIIITLHNYLTTLDIFSYYFIDL